MLVQVAYAPLYCWPMSTTGRSAAYTLMWCCNTLASAFSSVWPPQAAVSCMSWQYSSKLLSKLSSSRSCYTAAQYLHCLFIRFWLRLCSKNVLTSMWPWDVLVQTLLHNNCTEFRFCVTAVFHLKCPCIKWWLLRSTVAVILSSAFSKTPFRCRNRQKLTNITGRKNICSNTAELRFEHMHWTPAEKTHREM